MKGELEEQEGGLRGGQDENQGRSMALGTCEGRQVTQVACTFEKALGSRHVTVAPSPGVAAMLVLLPATMFHLLLVARSGPARLLAPPPYLPGLEELWSPSALLLLFIWLGLQVALYLLPARKVCTLLTHQGGLDQGERPPQPL